MGFPSSLLFMHVLSKAAPIYLSIYMNNFPFYDEEHSVLWVGGLITVKYLVHTDICSNKDIHK